MSRIWKRVPKTVRPRSSGRARLCCVAGLRRDRGERLPLGRLVLDARRSRPTFTATAYVVRMGAGAEARIPMRHTDSSSQSAVESANSLADR